MKKILYLTAVPWGWIKQRPQFLAEVLSNSFEVDVFSKKSYAIKSSDLLNKAETQYKHLKLKSFRILPFAAIPIIRHLPLGWINKLMLKFQIASIKKYDIIWVASASLYNLLKNRIKKNQILIYDCMDDVLEFPGTKNSHKRTAICLRNENQLLHDASLVFCSADYLKNKIVNRSGISAEKVMVVNNAIEIPNNLSEKPKEPRTKDIIQILKNNKSLVYIGTIDEWFDFESVLHVLDNRPELHMVLIGPMRGALPRHDRLHYMGTVPHNEIFHIMPHAFALMMPFKLNELIRSLNPVKLYEYIYAGVPVIATKYGETLKFNKYVNLYTDKHDLLKIVSRITENPTTIDIEDSRNFVKENTWKKRGEIINEQLNVIK